MHTVGIIKLKTHLLVNDIVIPLDEFTQQYIGNVLRSIASTFGSSGNVINITFISDELKLYAEGEEILLKNEFHCSIVESTVKGMISSLKGVVWFEKVSITTKE